jgi:hypothetical protein
LIPVIWLRLGGMGRMLGRRARGELEFLVCGSLRDLVPDDHVLARVDRVLDLGWRGCRCQALALAGDAAATDPVCSLSPHHAALVAAAEADAEAAPSDFVYRAPPR